MEASRTSSPPPSYDEAMRDRRPDFPPPYSERPEEQPQNGSQTTHCQNNRVAPIITNQDGIIMCQPFQQGRAITTQPQNRALSPRVKNKCGCNCCCASCKWHPWSCDCDCFCYNCLGFLAYLVFCLPAVFCCFVLSRICPETFGDCPNRESDLMDSYEERHDSTCSLCCWLCIGPCCCYSCDGSREVCPCAEPCRRHFGILTACKKMTCYCGSRKACDFNVSLMDEQSFGYICDYKDCGCNYTEENC